MGLGPAEAVDVVAVLIEVGSEADVGGMVVEVVEGLAGPWPKFSSIQ